MRALVGAVDHAQMAFPLNHQGWNLMIHKCLNLLSNKDMHCYKRYINKGSPFIERRGQRHLRVVERFVLWNLYIPSYPIWNQWAAWPRRGGQWQLIKHGLRRPQVCIEGFRLSILHWIPSVACILCMGPSSWRPYGMKMYCKFEVFHSSFDLHMISINLLSLVSLFVIKNFYHFFSTRGGGSGYSWNGRCRSCQVEGHGETRGQVFGITHCAHGQQCQSCQRGCGSGRWFIWWQWQLSCREFQIDKKGAGIYSYPRLAIT